MDGAVIVTSGRIEFIFGVVNAAVIGFPFLSNDAGGRFTPTENN
jgi:hypothetical protein